MFFKCKKKQISVIFFTSVILNLLKHVESLQFRPSPRSNLCWRHHESLLNGTCFRVIDGSKEILLRTNWSTLNYTFHVNGHSDVHASVTFRKSVLEGKEPLYLENEDKKEKEEREFKEHAKTDNKRQQLSDSEKRAVFKELVEKSREVWTEEEQELMEKSGLYNQALWVELTDLLDNRIPDVQLSFRSNFNVDSVNLTNDKNGRSFNKARLDPLKFERKGNTTSFGSPPLVDWEGNPNNDSQEVLIKKQAFNNVLVNCPFHCYYTSIKIKGNRRQIHQYLRPMKNSQFDISVQSIHEGYSLIFMMNDNKTELEVAFFEKSIKSRILYDSSTLIWNDTVPITYNKRLDIGCRYFAKYEDEFRTEVSIAPFVTIRVKLLVNEKLVVYIQNNEQNDMSQPIEIAEFTWPGAYLGNMSAEYIYLDALSELLPKESAPEDGSIVFAIPKESLRSPGILIEEQRGRDSSIISCDVYGQAYIPDITSKERLEILVDEEPEQMKEPLSFKLKFVLFVVCLILVLPVLKLVFQFIDRYRHRIRLNMMVPESIG